MSSDIRPLSLQFETAQPLGEPGASPVTPVVSCFACQRTIADEYFDVNTRSVCGDCRQRLLQETQTPVGIVPLARGAVFGTVAAVLGAALYYAVMAIAHLEIGIVAIAIGFMVGYAIRLGTRGRGGRRFQVMAVVLTYWAVGLAYTPIAIKGAAESASTVASEAKPDARTTASPEPAPRAQAASQPVGIVTVLAILLGFSFALPLLVVFGSLPGGVISAAIIAFGMRQAWQMTAAPALRFDGPYRVASAPAAS